MNAIAPGATRMRKQNIALTAFLLFSLVMVIGLTYGIIYGLKHGPRMDEPPVGAGGGATAGANGLGEWLAGNRADKSAKEAETLVDPATLEQGFILLVTDATRKSSQSDPIYFASNVTGWNPGDPAFKLTPQSDMKWRIHLTKPRSKSNPNEPIEFKFARGTWDACEVNADLSDRPNRTLPKVDVSKLKAGEIPTIEFTVPHWADERPNAKKADDGSLPTVSIGTLKRLEVGGPIGKMPAPASDVLVWLPPGYDDPKNAATTYPVLYMHDGQNLFSKPATAPGEWQFDETCGRLIEEGKIRPLIVVGLPSDGRTRTAEYLPPVTTEEVLPGLTPQGDAHVAWLMSEVMPRVERAFRVATGPANTGIGGSSLGGLISLYIGARHHETFGMVLAESPALRFGKNEFGKSLFANVNPWPTKVYIAVGTAEAGEGNGASKDFAEAVKFLDGQLKEAGLTESREKFVLEEGATHNEAAWAKRLPGAMEFLFGK